MNGAPGYRSTRFSFWIVAAPVAILALSGCGSNPPEPVATSARQDAVINPPRSSRGNPPFYEVLGNRYYVRETSVGYRETGVASWYGQKFHGLPTSSGETYDMHAMTAAHTTLPLPTWAEVTHLGNGKSVIVKINDRGPFLHNRLIDLSYAAAQELDMVREGTARVQVRALGAPAVGAVPPTQTIVYEASKEPSGGGFSLISEAAAATPPQQQANGTRRFYVQVGAFSTQDNAEQLVNSLAAAGYGGVFVDSDVSRTPPLHRVRIGPFARTDQVSDVVDGLSALGVADTHLVVEH